MSADDLAKKINKLLGEGTVQMASEVKVEYLPTGVLPLDWLLGGGLPRGRMVELFGPYSTLKSYVGLSAIGRTQQAGGRTMLVDTERSFDPEWARHLGVDVESLVYVSPPTIEEAVDITEVAIRDRVDLIVWDSVAASLPAAEREKREAGEKHQPARLAAMMSRATRKLNSANESTAILWINQVREKVGVVYGSPETTPGGRALGFFASYRVALRKAGKLTEEVKSHDGHTGKTIKETTGWKVRATLEKSKLSKPHREVLFTFDLTTGRVDESRWLVAQMIEQGGITRSGASYQFGDESWRGIEAVVGAVKDSESLQETMKEFVFAALPKSGGQ